jgi:hypothetical protein
MTMTHSGDVCRSRPLVVCNSETAFNANRHSRVPRFRETSFAHPSAPHCSILFAQTDRTSLAPFDDQGYLSL